ncbi:MULTISPECIES: PaaI family thioesterase [unclassified Aureispira]|uniref:PaaI family thioesterase n=1 Tax=unclassified Aureispira TaxID=2649989 RepID=UPI000697D046|nr:MULTISPECIES: PaaI family thioesterase [unclassified Aureispira]WMX15065.1 PaaI family thioesterase [Aureispira sp. CCB-E]
MKADYIQQLKENLGQKMGEYLPGLGAWLNGAVTAITEEGDVEIAFEVREDMLNPMGAIHGGAVAAIIDEILGFQLFLKSDKDAAYVSMTMNIDFLKGAKVGEVITGIPKVIRIGKRTANVRCILKNEKGQLIAQGVSNFMRVV